MTEPTDKIQESVPLFDIELLTKSNLQEHSMKFCMEQDFPKEDVALVKEKVIDCGLATSEDIWNGFGIQTGNNGEKLWLAMVAKNQNDKSIYFCVYHDISLHEVESLGWYGLIRKSPKGLDQTTFSSESDISGEKESELAYLIFRIVSDHGIVKKIPVIA